MSCRNVLIYLDSALQRRVVPVLHYALRPGGFLLLGNSETLSAFGDLFALVDKKHKIFVRRQTAAPARFDFGAGLAPKMPAERMEREPLAGAEKAGQDLQKQADRVVLARYAPAGVIIDENFEVVQFRGKTSPYLEPAPGRASLNLLKMMKEGLLLAVRSAVQTAKRTGHAARKRDVPAKQDRGYRPVNIEVIPLRLAALGRFYYLVQFEESRAHPASPARDKRSRAVEDRRVPQLRQELAATREYLQSIIEEQEATNEELQSANEEVLSSNEELQSINEELETAKEELQSANEELTTVNEEMQDRNTELSLTNDDLTNLLGSVNIAIVMLGSDFRVRRFTPMAGRLLNLIPTDLGRPILDVRPSVRVPDLEAQITEVIEEVTVKEREVTDELGHWYTMTIRPYRTSDNRIDGAVLTLVDIDMLKRSLQEADEVRDLAEAIIETASEPLVVLDGELKLRRSNAAFFELLRLPREDTKGKRIDQVAPGLRGLVPLLEQPPDRDGSLPGGEIEFYSAQGRRTLRVTLRAFRREGRPQLILLGLRDMTGPNR